MAPHRVRERSSRIDCVVHQEWEGDFEPWSNKTASILQKYTTNERIAITVVRPAYALKTSRGDARPRYGY